MASFLVTTLAIIAVLLLANRLSNFVMMAVTKLGFSAKNPVTYGKWAVVTGATDGIGKAIAFELAKKGCNLILISRTQSKLESVEKEIKDAYGSVEIELIAVDYSEFDINSSSFEEVSKVLEKRKEELGVLVNNVGMSYPFPKYFHELTNEESSNLISLNVTSTTLMTKLFLPFVLEKKRGAIVNIGSFAGIMASPLLAEYSAAKAYVESLTRSLSVEYAKSGVDFQCHVPLYIVSKMSKIRKPNFMTPTAEQYAKLVIENIGGSVVISPHLVQSVFTEVVKMLPEATVLEKVKQMHEKIRAKGMKKMQKQE